MSKKSCYFRCKNEGHLYGFPPMSYNSYERYNKWKDVLRKEDKEKGDYFITHYLKICSNHFEKFYITPLNRLTRHAVPTLQLGISLLQEESLCEFIDENHEVVMEYSSSSQLLEKLLNKWTEIASRLNACGPDRSPASWAEYVFEVMTDLKRKESKWLTQTDKASAKNKEIFTKLEQKILQIWYKVRIDQESSEHLESDFREENEITMEYIIEDDDSRDSGTSKVSETSRVSEIGRDNEIVTFTLNLATGGQKPLLQAADIAPYEGPHDYSNVKCTCSYDKEADDEFDAFGRDIAQQLRSMPSQTALETRRLLMSVLRSKQSKILNNSFLQS